MAVARRSAVGWSLPHGCAVLPPRPAATGEGGSAPVELPPRLSAVAGSAGGHGRGSGGRVAVLDAPGPHDRDRSRAGAPGRSVELLAALAGMATAHGLPGLCEAATR